MAAPQPDTSGLSIVPLPQSVTRGHGTFVLTASTVIVADAPFTHLGHQLAAMIGPATGFDLVVRPGRAPGSNFLALREDAALEKTLGAEGYRLESTAKGVTIRAATPAGVFYGIETLRQLLPTAIFRSARVGGIEWRIPAVSIDDMPRFSWRGGHLDVARH